MDPGGPGGGSHKGLQVVAAAAAAAAANVTTTTTALVSRNNSTDPVVQDTCPEWIEWAEWTLPSWCSYILISALLACASAVLVRSYAPYAAGSGISEIKCCLLYTSPSPRD